MKDRQSEQVGRELESVQTRQIGGVPLFYPLLQALGVRELTNSVVSSQADVDPGRVVELLTLNRLLSPRPLYQVAEWLGETVLPDLTGVKPEQMYDNRIGRVLERLYPHLGELWARVVSRALAIYDLDLRTLHWDLTSLYVEGVYAESDLSAYG